MLLADPKNPRALAGRLRQAQTFIRTLGIEIAFGREGRLGTRTIRITAIGDTMISTVSRVCDNGHGLGLKHPPPRSATGTWIAKTTPTQTQTNRPRQRASKAEV